MKSRLRLENTIILNKKRRIKLLFFIKTFTIEKNEITTYNLLCRTLIYIKYKFYIKKWGEIYGI